MSLADCDEQATVGSIVRDRFFEKGSSTLIQVFGAPARSILAALRPFAHRSRALGWPLLGFGVAFNAWFLRTIRREGVPIRTDRPVPKLTTEGPFRYSRNPSYLALAMIYAGIAVLRNSLWTLLLLPFVVIVVQREVIGREERYPERAFGEEYRAYKDRVRRWI